ncbi:hypothetical protein PWT90_06982 [Aphanocladium album]|nr:hypothetical protein PWT90_06982 [Aphanocladium album]
MPLGSFPSLILVFEPRSSPYFPASERNGVYLRVENGLGEGHPVLVASMQTPRPQWVARKGPFGFKCCSVENEVTLAPCLSHHCIPLLLFPFAHVLVFRYQNQHDADGIQQQVEAWHHAQQHLHSQLSMPEIVVLLQNEAITVSKLRRFLSVKLKRVVSVVKMGDQNYSSHGLAPICERSAPALARSQQKRVKNKMLFSVDHFRWLFSHSMAIRKQLKPFQILRASRAANPVASDLLKHLSNFINVLPEDVDPEFVSETIASTFLFDHWTETMHGRRDRFLDACLLCGHADYLRVHFRPRTCATGALCFDGGGVRGGLSIVVLEMLFQAIGLPIPIQRHFQFVCGVSAGALNAIGLFIKGLPPTQCLKIYERVASKIFRPQHRLPVVSFIMSLLHSPIYDGQAAGIVYRETYGDACLLDPSYASSIGTRVMLPVATTPAPLIKGLTNYNGVGDSKMRLDYQVYENCGDVTLSDAALSCTAAPTFFPPVWLEQVGEQVQDPGVIENNAIALAQAEINAYYGSSKACQFILNIGTGSRGVFPEQRQAADSLGGVRQWLTDWVLGTAISRVGLGYGRLLSGAPIWAKYMRGMDPGSWLLGRLIRLDVTFDRELPLDDVGAMAKLKARAESDPVLAAAVASMARRITAALFYFELDSRPRQYGCIFSAAGTILCQCDKGDPALPLLIDKLSSEGAVFVLNDQELDAHLLSSWNSDGEFGMAVSLQLTSPEFRLSVRWPDGVTYPISSSKFSLPRLVEEQGLDAPFGLAAAGHIPKLPALRRDTSRPRAKTAQPRGAKRSQHQNTFLSSKLQRCR